MAGYNKLRNTYTKILLAFGILLVTLTLATLASTPPIGRDALTHHLALPKLYLEHGGIYEIPEIDFSYYPMNLDFLYLFCLYIGNDILPKFIHFFFGLATAILIFKYLKNKLSSQDGLIGALFFLTIPVIVKLSITAYVDLGLVFFSFFSILNILSWLNRQKNRSLIIAGISCGLALGTKYNALLTFLLLSLLTPLYYIQASRQLKNISQKSINFTLVFCGLALITSGGWWLRNYYWTGNPLFPLYDSFFNPRQHINDITTSYKIFAMREILYGEKWWQILLLPVRMFFEGADNNPQLFDGRLNPFLLVLPIAAFIPLNKNYKKPFDLSFLATFSILYFFIAFFSTVLRVRYIAPIIAPLTILSIYGLNNCLSFINCYFHPKKFPNALRLILVSLILLPNFLYLYQQFKLIEPLEYISGKITRDTFLLKHLPDYSTKHYANMHLSPHSKLLCFFLGRRGYYIENQHIFAEPFKKATILKIMQNKGLSSTLVYLKQEGITHFLVQDSIMLKAIGNLSQEENVQLWYQLFRDYTQKMYSAHGYSLYMLKQ